MIGYFVFVALGIVAAFVARRWQGDVSGLDTRERAGLLFVAIGGAILGAYALQLPADVFGWNAPVPEGAVGLDGGVLAHGIALGGRTVLGGLIGGWLAVEAGKRAVGIRRATGDAFALPLAVALAFGRVGCWYAGCCGGRACEPGLLTCLDAHGTPRVPTQLVEVVFHGLAGAWIALAHRRNWIAGRRLAAYLSAYALVRFTLEFVREQPLVALGLTYHQFLSLALLTLAGGTWWARSRASVRSST